MNQPTRATSRFSRRRFLKVGSFVLAGSALFAACDDAAPTNLPPTLAASPTPPPTTLPPTTAAPTATPAPPTATSTPVPPTATPTVALPTATPTSTRALITSSKPIKIGLLYPQTKVYADAGDALNKGAMLYFDSTSNVAGGHRLEFLREDDENDGPTALRKVRRWITDDDIDFLMGVVATPVALALRDVVDQNKLPFVSTDNGGLDLTRKRKSRYIVRTSYSTWQKNYPLGEWAYNNKSKKIVAMTYDATPGLQAVGAFSDGLEKAGGKLMDEYDIKPDTTDFYTLLIQARQSNPNGVYTFFEGDAAITFVKQYDEAGLKGFIPLFTTDDTLNQATLTAVGKFALGALVATNYVPTLNNPENKKFVADYTAKYGKMPDSFALQGYDAARVVAETINALQGNLSDPAKVADVLAAVKFNSPRGPFEIDPDTRNVIQNIYLCEVKEQNGKFVSLPTETVFQKVKDPGK